MTRRCIALKNVFRIIVTLPLVVSLGCNRASEPSPRKVEGPSSSAPPKAQSFPKLPQIVEIKAREILSDETVQAWQDAGGDVGWMGTSEYMTVYFTNNPAGIGAEGAPGFRFVKWPQPALSAKLPAPNSAFGLSLRGAITDAGLKELTRFTYLSAIDLSDLKITNVGLKELAVLNNLQMIALRLTPVTDDGLKGLAALKNLRALDLGMTGISDSGFEKLDLASLRTLALDSTQITDLGLKRLAQLKNLRKLYLDRTRITDVGLKNLASVASLQTLNISECMQITDDGLKELAPLKNLQELILIDCMQITDDGLKELASLKNLKKVYARGTKYTAEGLADLKKALPNCTFDR